MDKKTITLLAFIIVLIASPLFYIFHIQKLIFVPFFYLALVYSRPLKLIYFVYDFIALIYFLAIFFLLNAGYLNCAEWMLKILLFIGGIIIIRSFYRKYKGFY